jgi:hypothetical protein
MNPNPEIRHEIADESGHFQGARRLLADELRLRLDASIKDEDLMPILDLPAPFKGDRFNCFFGFSIGQGFKRKTFVIQFQADHRGNPIFELKPVADPSLLRLRLTGGLSAFDKGRCQIERILEKRPSDRN